MLLEDSIRGLSLKINVTLQPVPFSKKTSGDLQAKGPKNSSLQSDNGLVKAWS